MHNQPAGRLPGGAVRQARIPVTSQGGRGLTQPHHLLKWEQSCLAAQCPHAAAAHCCRVCRPCCRLLLTPELWPDADDTVKDFSSKIGVTMTFNLDYNA